MLIHGFKNNQKKERSIEQKKLSRSSNRHNFLVGGPIQAHNISGR